MLGTMPGCSPHLGGTRAGSCWLGLPPQPRPCHVPGLSAEGCVRTDTEAPSLTLPGALPAAGPPGGATAGAGARRDYQRCSYGPGCSFGRLLCCSHEREGRHRQPAPAHRCPGGCGVDVVAPTVPHPPFLLSLCGVAARAAAVQERGRPRPRTSHQHRQVRKPLPSGAGGHASFGFG